MAGYRGPTGVDHMFRAKHLCCGEETRVFPVNYCPFCGKIVRIYGVEVDTNGIGQFFADQLKEAGVKVVMGGKPSFPSVKEKKDRSPGENEAISIAFRCIDLALQTTNGAIATDLPDLQPDETSWKVDNSKAILSFQYLEYLFNNTDTDS